MRESSSYEDTVEAGRNMDTSQGASERRGEPRVPINEFVELNKLGLQSPAKALVMDMSASGLAVAHCLLGDVGERLRCRMLFTPHEPIAVDCRVVWTRQATDDDPAAMGLCFEDFTETRRMQLRRYLNRVSGQRETSRLVIDPFCESGSWTPEELPEMSDRSLEVPRGPYAAPAPRIWQPMGSARWEPNLARKALIIGTLLVLGVAAGLVALMLTML